MLGYESANRKLQLIDIVCQYFYNVISYIQWSFIALYPDALTPGYEVILCINLGHTVIIIVVECGHCRYLPLAS